jgi:hypothetical protein
MSHGHKVRKKAGKRWKNGAPSLISTLWGGVFALEKSEICYPVNS